MTDNQISMLEILQQKVKQSYDSISEQLAQAKQQRKNSCEHKKINKYRYYGSGMHRPEYTFDCSVCKQDLSFDEYCKAAANGADIKEHNM